MPNITLPTNKAGKESTHKPVLPNKPYIARPNSKLILSPKRWINRETKGANTITEIAGKVIISDTPNGSSKTRFSSVSDGAMAALAITNKLLPSSKHIRHKLDIEELLISSS